MCFMMFLQINHIMSLLCPLCMYKVLIFLKVTLELLDPKFVGPIPLVDGENKISKQILETIDHEKKVLTLKEFEGDVTDKYDSFKATLHIETKDEIDLVSWTLEYERPNENVPELINLLNFVVGMTKAIDDHHAN
ncbi:kirola-like isoform X4 [Solanum stenotomum]|uniref:kirola-like isoform X4 n=1 Tax=Solanum stenotomum TaxID=172797 RepID=UPI0020D0B979|nr:kirola-like isoform X4 [Solanum stenotomum]